MRRITGTRGFTLIEILIVISIVSILAGLAIAGVARLNAGAKQELSRTARHLHTMLRAAKQYASTYRVDTAVVYNLDGYFDFNMADVYGANLYTRGDLARIPLNNGLASAMTDTVTGQHVRVIEAAAVVYKMPTTAKQFSGKFVPVPGDLGQFTKFEGEQIMSLNDPYTGVTYYASNAARFENYPGNRIGELGMKSVDVLLGQTGPFAERGTLPFLDPVVVKFPAHVFTSSGRLDASGRERFTLYIAPPPNSIIDDLITVPADVTSERITQQVHLYRSTGRVKMPG